jgi:hypothetical protein
MNFRLVDSGWLGLLGRALQEENSRVRIICPFIKEQAALRILEHGRPQNLQVITRFDLDAFVEGASDVEALQILQSRGAQIRGIRNLHAKVYLIGSNAIVTSANLTMQALRRNHEFGFESSDPEIFNTCAKYFEDLWQRAGKSVSRSKLDQWYGKVQHALSLGGGSRPSAKLGDEGTDVGFAQESHNEHDWVAAAEQGFVKFFGEGTNRLDRSYSILSEVERAGCHWACSYPKRPRRPFDGALMFMGRLVKSPNDILIFGRAVGMQHKDGRDDASEADLVQRPWKVHWPYYVRVHDAEFIDGTLSAGISLNELMDALDSDAFGTTQRHAQAGEGGNTSPRAAIMQQPHVELTTEAIAWLNERFEERIARHGKISRKQLAKLDWPTIPYVKE